MSDTFALSPAQVEEAVRMARVLRAEAAWQRARSQHHPVLVLHGGVPARRTRDEQLVHPEGPSPLARERLRALKE